MNYLAHAYLSFGHPAILAGNMSSDFIKGRSQYDYPASIQAGIRLHRKIDAFTDEHAVIREMKGPFRKTYGLYAGAFIDIVCDYFLANDTTIFEAPEYLEAFAQSVYVGLNEQLSLMPPVFTSVLQHMEKHNWLYHYRYTWGIERSFAGMARKAKYITETASANQVFADNLHFFEGCYRDFFPLLKNYSLDQFNLLVNVE